MTITLEGPLLLVGAGKMGGALLAGWLDQGLAAGSIFVQEPNPPDKIAALIAEHAIATGMPPKLPGLPAVIVLAVKPQIMDAVLPPLKAMTGADTVVLSIAAGQRIARLEERLGSDCAIVRSMPNTAAAIGRGITVACCNSSVTPALAERCIALLNAMGEVAWIEDEALLDPVTAVSGSGPAYVFLLCECLAEAGITAGLDEELAGRLARATISGAGEMLSRSELSAGELRRDVTSPGGTTDAALEVLTRGGLQKLMAAAVEAAAKRSRELSS